MVAELGGTRIPKPEQMLARLLRVEYALGRRRESQRCPLDYESDLDLLLYGDHTSATEFLVCPIPVCICAVSF